MEDEILAFLYPDQYPDDEGITDSLIDSIVMPVPSKTTKDRFMEL